MVNEAESLEQRLVHEEESPEQQRLVHEEGSPEQQQLGRQRLAHEEGLFEQQRLVHEEGLVEQHLGPKSSAHLPLWWEGNWEVHRTRTSMMGAQEEA